MKPVGDWVWSIPHRQPAKVEECFDLWGDEALRLWLPQDDTFVRVRASEVRPLEASDLGHVERVKRIRELSAKLPGFGLVGNAYDGVGIPQCIRGARLAAAAF